MTGGESVFSFIKHPDVPDEAERYVAAPPPKQYDELCAKLTTFEAKIAKLEEINSASAAAAAGSKSETQVAQLKCSGLEHEVAGQKKIRSDFESLSHNVSHLSVLFNQLRTELAFLMPKKRESIGDQGCNYSG